MVEFQFNASRRGKEGPNKPSRRKASRSGDGGEEPACLPVCHVTLDL